MGLHLHLRLKNCLQTIIDIESDVELYPLYGVLKSEMDTLKKFLIEIESMELSEDDVVRLEDATTLFLNEIYLLSSNKANIKTKNKILQ